MSNQYQELTPDPARFVFQKNRTCAAGFVGCYATEINKKIKQDGTLIPGSPSGGIWDGQVSAHYNKPDMDTAVQQMDQGIKDLVNAWITNKKCKTVKVTEVGPDGNQTSTSYDKTID